MKNSIANRQGRYAKPGPVLKAGGGYRSGSQRMPGNGMGLRGGMGSGSLHRQNSGSQANFFIKQNIKQMGKYGGEKKAKN